MSLSAQRETEIAEEEIRRSLADENRIVAELSKEGLIGDIHMPGPERLDRYWLLTKDLADLPGLTDPTWEDRIRQGFDNPPVNPFWVNLLREPGLLKKTAADFMSLNAKYQDRYA